MKSFFVLALALSAGISQAQDNWHQFRGPTGRGHTSTEIATEWSAKHVAWQTPTKGTGQSSVVNFGNKLFITGASTDGKDRYVECFDADTGDQLWLKTIRHDQPGSIHKMNSYATPTCAVDAERVIAFFGAAGLHCYDHDGNELWKRTDLGDFPGSWGTAASPVLHDDLILLNCDATGPSRFLGIDKTTGETVWETPREDKPKGGWSTPIVIEFDGKTEIVLNGEFGVRGYDPVKGSELWFCKGFNGRGAPVPEFSDGILFVVNGKPGDTYAVKPGGSGDVTDSRMLWHAERRGGRDLPSPAVVGDFLIVSTMNGIASCYNTKTGDTLWTERLEGMAEIAAAPLVANGLVYFQAVYGGDVVVIRPGKTLDIVAKNSLGASQQESFRSTLAPIGGRLYSRSDAAIYCIEKP